MKSSLSTAISLLFCGLSLAASTDSATPEGRLVRTFDFNDPTLWRDRGANNIFLSQGWNNITWGRKDIYVRPCQGYTGTGLMFDIRGISQGQLQFWTPPWPMQKDKYYRISYRARAFNFDGGLDVYVRGIAGWNVILHGRTVYPTEEWQEFSFSGKVDNDYSDEVDPKSPYNTFGLLFTAADLGQIMIDDVRIEEFDENPDPILQTANPTPVTQGNLVPNSSLELERDPFWSTAIPQNDPDLHMTDPGFVRVEGGKFGRYCYELQPIVTREPRGGATTRSLPIPVASGVQYTLSFWARGEGRAWAWVGLGHEKIEGESAGVSQLIPGPREPWTDTWRRYTLTTKVLPDAARTLSLSFQKGGEGKIFIDGLQLEVGDTPTDYTPDHPYSIEATIEGGMPNITPWGAPIPLRLTAYTSLSETPTAEIPATLRVTAFPDKIVLEKEVTLTPGKTLAHPIDPIENGIFRIELLPKNPATAPTYETIAARLPAPREDVGRESFFGTHISVRPYFIDYARKIGIKWVRLHDCSNITKMKWGNPEPDVYQWHDESIDAIRAAGLHILGLPDYFSDFAILKNEEGKKTGIDNAAFANWCRRVAEHYRGRIDDWEVVNEPYFGHFYPGSPAQFSDTFRAGADALREGNPSARILGWCTELSTIGFPAKLPKDSIRDTDTASIHMYFCAAPGGGTMRLEDDIAEYRKAFFPDNTWPGSIWNTEGSWGGATLFYSFGKANPRALLSSAACGARIWIAQKAAGFDKFFFFTTHQTDTLQYRGGYKMLLEYDRTPTIAAAATATTAWFIDGLDAIPITRARGVEEALFSGKGRTTYTVYKDPLETHPVTLNLDALPSHLLITDVMGTDLRHLPATSIPLIKTPIFILSTLDSPQSLLQTCRNAIQRGE